MLSFKMKNTISINSTGLLKAPDLLHSKNHWIAKIAIAYFWLKKPLSESILSSK
jgi:hypothetical protein